MSSDQIPDPDTFLITARCYREGAFAILTNEKMREKYDTDRRFVLPAAMLIGHAIEVYLKAWISSRGIDKATIRKNYGHNLTMLLAEALATGLPEPERSDDYTFHDLIESFARNHEKYAFRYPESSWKYDVPQMDIVFEILNDLDVAVASVVHRAIPEAVDLEPNLNLRLPSD